MLVECLDDPVTSIVERAPSTSECSGDVTAMLRTPQRSIVDQHCLLLHARNSLYVVYSYTTDWAPSQIRQPTGI